MNDDHSTSEIVGLAAKGDQGSGKAGPASPGHKDEERPRVGVFYCGGTLALLARRGVRVQVLTATRGEGGSCGDPLLCVPEELPAVREAELRCACAALGIEPVLVKNLIRHPGVSGSKYSPAPARRTRDANLPVPAAKRLSPRRAFSALRSLFPSPLVQTKPHTCCRCLGSGSVVLLHMASLHVVAVLSNCLLGAS
jgi:hypothetical protein